jgi:hypothetical protein
MRYEGSWWSIEVPEGWDIDQDEYCTSFVSPSGTGALQISAARKQSGVISDDDLLAQAQKRTEAGASLSPVATAHASGFTAAHARENSEWQEWWLRSDDTLLYVTWIRAAGDDAGEDAVAREMIETLAVLAQPAN